MNPPVRSAARALDLLELVADAPRGVSLTEAAAALQLPKSSALMLLRTLAARGYVVRSDGDRYVLNETFRKHGFGWGGNRVARLMAVAGPAMQRLSDRLGETVILATLDRDGHVRLLAKVIARQDVRYDVDLSSRLPAYCTALGRVLLGRMDRVRRQAILTKTKRVRRTPHTITDLERLHGVIDQAAAEGYAILEEEFALGATGVAAPITDAEGRVVAALDVGCVTARFQAKRAAVISMLQKEAAGLSAVVTRTAVVQTRGIRRTRTS